MNLDFYIGGDRTVDEEELIWWARTLGDWRPIIHYICVIENTPTRKLLYDLKNNRNGTASVHCTDAGIAQDI